jgi:hypothetical protein
VRIIENNNTTIDRHGFHLDKSINKRHILAVSAGLRRLAAMAHQAGIQGRDGGLLLVAMPIENCRCFKRWSPHLKPEVKKRLSQLNVKNYPPSRRSKYLKTPIQQRSATR